MNSGTVALEDVETLAMQLSPLQKVRLVERMVSHLARRADVEETPHTLRHTFAKNLVNSGVSLEKVAALMGHSNLNTTSIYTIPSALDLERAVAQIGE